MHPARIDVTRRRTLLALALALGAGLPPPAQADVLDFTVASINPGVFISYAGGSPSGPPVVESNLKVIDLSLMGDLSRQLSPAITPHNSILNFQTGPLADYFSPVPSASYVWMFGGLSPQRSITLQGGIPALAKSDGTPPLSGSFGTARVTEPAPVGVNPFFYVAGSNFTDHRDDAWLASLGLHRQTAKGNFDPGFAASFASAPGALTRTMVPSGNNLNHRAPISSTLLLLGCGLMGLAGLRYRRRRG